MQNETFGQRLARLRKDKGLSQAKLANKLGTNPSSVGDWESERYYPQTVFLMALATFYDVSTDYLLGFSSGEAVALPRVSVECVNKLNAKELKMVSDFIEYVYYLHKTRN